MWLPIVILHQQGRNFILIHGLETLRLSSCDAMATTTASHPMEDERWAMGYGHSYWVMVHRKAQRIAHRSMCARALITPGRVNIFSKYFVRILTDTNSTCVPSLK